MMVIRASSANWLYHSVLKELLGNGVTVAPRGKNTREILGATLYLADANDNIVTTPERKLNYGFMAAEWLWIMTGCSLVDAIMPFNKNLSIARDEGSHSFLGAYGPKWIEQLDYVLDTLRKDALSRQAIVNIWRDRPRRSNDTPCTLDWQFFVREGRVHMHGRMRSNDAWLGLPYDLYNFTQIQRWVAAQLGYGVGSYTHFVGSMHLYEEHFERAEAVAKSTVHYFSNVPDHMGSSVPPLAMLQQLLLDAASVKTRVTAIREQRGDPEATMLNLIQRWHDQLLRFSAEWTYLPYMLLNDPAFTYKFCPQIDQVKLVLPIASALYPHD